MYTLKVILGIILIAVGISGLFLPIVPGIALIILGLFLINAKWVREKIKHSKITKKYHAWLLKRKKRG